MKYNYIFIDVLLNLEIKLIAIAITSIKYYHFNNNHASTKKPWNENKYKINILLGNP